MKKRGYKIVLENKVPLIIIAVSSGQGRAATELAMEQINSGGCIYLFAGFQPGDTITTDDANQNLDAWAIQTDWKHEQVSVRGKPLTLSGHRGSRVHDLEQASDQIRQHELAFSKLLSHVISLDALPDAMQSLLSSNSEIRGRMPRRVVINHAAPRQTLEPYEETPLRHLYEATRKPKKDISKGNIFRDIGFDGERSMLGWVLPPPWAAVRKEIEAVVDLGFVDSAEFIIWVGTGSWSFALEALQHVVVPRSTGATTFLVLNSLDPAALAGVLRRIEGRLSRVVCVGISQSGSALETTMLMDTLRGCFEQAKLDHHEHFLWLTDIGGPSKIHVTGEVTIRSSTTTTHDWSKTRMVPLTVNNHADINALFCSPHSMATLLPLFILLGKDRERMQTVFEQYVSLRPHTAEKMLQDMQSVAFALFETIWAVFDKDLGSAADKLAIQLVEQGLGSKRSDFNPTLEVSTTPTTRAGSDAATTLDFSRRPGSTRPAAKLMLTMYGLSIFVAAMAYHRGINFVTHPNVDFYKRRAKQLAQAKNAVSIQSTVEDVCDATVAYVQAHPKLRRVNLLYYCHEWFYDGSAILDALIRQLHKSGFEDIPICLAQGEERNHSRFQGAMQAEDALHVVVGFECGAFPAVPGVSDEAMRANFQMLQSIARATHERWHNGGWQRDTCGGDSRETVTVEKGEDSNGVLLSDDVKFESINCS
ncbi:hypothetical protein MY4038_010093 [Beauveria bassiana]